MLDPNDRVVLRFRITYAGKEKRDISFDGSLHMKDMPGRMFEIQNDGRVYIYDHDNVYLHIGPDGTRHITQKTPWFTPRNSDNSLIEKEKDVKVS